MILPPEWLQVFNKDERTGRVRTEKIQNFIWKEQTAVCESEEYTWSYA